ncbi:decaprenyl-phosphate phosphoribosyltransferase, partial [Clostridium botulinum]|nr:decaprenyl-phosphate phosphoribosyltransferase [Clostridium botulinum]
MFITIYNKYIYLLYIVMNIFYCFKLKNVVILDVM